MIKEIIELLKKEKQISEEQYQKYIQFKESQAQITYLEARRERLQSEINKIKNIIEQTRLLDRIFNRQKINSEKYRLNNLKKDLKDIELQLESEKRNHENYNFTEETINKINIYEKLLEAENNYNLGNMNKVASYFFDELGFDFNHIIDICKKNGILIDLSEDKEAKFFEEIRMMIHQKRINDKNYTGKINSLSEMMLVRKTDFIPEDDKIICPFKTVTYSQEETVTLDGKDHKVNLDLPLGHHTIHFCLGQEVLPHKDAPQGWKTKMIILQPLTEELYKSAVRLEALDTFYAGEVNLENYFIICEDIETAKDIVTKNKTAIPIIVGKDKVNGFGNKILRAMGIKCPYQDHNGMQLDNTIPLETYYTDEAIKNYPRLVSNNDARGLATNNPVHNSAKSAHDIVRYIERVDKITEHIMKTNSFEEAIEMVKRNLLTEIGGAYILAQEVKENQISYENILPDKYNNYGDFLDFIIKYSYNNNEKMDAQIIFEKMCSNIEITESNINQFKRIKEYVIQLINEYEISRKKVNELYENDNKWRIVTYNLLILNKIMRTDIMKMNISRNHAYNVPIEYYDLKKHEEQLQEILSSLLNSGNSIEEATEKIYQMFLEGKLPTFDDDIPLQRPESNNLLYRANSLISTEYEKDALDAALEYKIQTTIEKLDKKTEHDVYIENINELTLSIMLLEEKNAKKESYNK